MLDYNSSQMLVTKTFKERDFVRKKETVLQYMKRGDKLNLVTLSQTHTQKKTTMRLGPAHTRDKRTTRRKKTDCQRESVRTHVILDRTQVLRKECVT
jgi:hypothetical protein